MFQTFKISRKLTMTTDKQKAFAAFFAKPIKRSNDEAQNQSIAKIPKLEDAQKPCEAKPLNSDGISYGMLCQTFEKIEATTKRLLISSYLTDFFGKVIDSEGFVPQTLIESVYLCLNRIGPDYEGKELGIGESLLIKAIATISGRKPQAIKAEVAEKGDLGLVAQVI